jgi:hypothetical protein
MMVVEEGCSEEGERDYTYGTYCDDTNRRTNHDEFTICIIRFIHLFMKLPSIKTLS